MQLEKLRKFQNTTRTYRQHADLPFLSYNGYVKRKSHYFNEMIVDEQKSMPLPTFIRTGDSYFREKEHYLNTMVSAKGLPTLFVTLSMAESKWIHLTEILHNTDNACMYGMYIIQEQTITFESIEQNCKLSINKAKLT